MAENNTPPIDLNNPNDVYFKGVMGMKTVAIAFNKQFLPKSILDKLDLSTLELDTVSYITDELKQNFADVVWKCMYKNGEKEVRITLLYEHKSYKEKYPHLQLLRYILGAWDTQIKQHKVPFMTIPIVLYHGQEKWDEASLDSYFGGLDPELLRFLPCFDYVLINLQKYSDTTIRAIDSIFLYKSLLAFKHFWDTVYLKLNFVELLVNGLVENKDDETRSFLNRLYVYLLAISKLTTKEALELVNNSDHNLKHQAMTIFEEFEVRGIEKGEKQGIEKGEKQGIEKANHETIIRSWKNGIEISMIANITGLDIAKIKAVIAGFQSNA